MSNTATKTMLSAYFQSGEPQMFLSSFFRTPPENFYETESVEVDIVRNDEDIAIVVQDLNTGYRMNSEDLYTNKEFVPPIFKEGYAVKTADLLKRIPENNPFQSPLFQAQATARAMRLGRLVEKKIRRSIELQASQILSTGTVTLSDAAGTALYTIDYKPKATHFPTATIGWGNANAVINEDVINLCEQVRDDGLVDPEVSLWGTAAYRAAMSNAVFKTKFETRRLDEGTISPWRPAGKGGQYRGTVDFGNFKLDVWTYGGRYKDPQTGNKIQYLTTNKVTVMGGDPRFDATFGAIPRIVPVDQRLLPFLPQRGNGAGLDMFWNAWLSIEQEQVFAGVGSRPLLIPTAIDQYGTIDANL